MVLHMTIVKIMFKMKSDCKSKGRPRTEISFFSFLCREFEGKETSNPPPTTAAAVTGEGRRRLCLRRQQLHRSFGRTSGHLGSSCCRVLHSPSS